MARRASIVGQCTDLWGDVWDVHEARPSRHGFDVFLGWPAVPHGRGGAQVIVTQELSDYLRTYPQPILLPIGATSIKRLRRLLGISAALYRAEWWETRAADLGNMSIEEFAEKHRVSVGSASQARTALFGAKLRPAGWWRAHDVAKIILADRPVAEIADALDISAGSVRRLRWGLRTGIDRGFTPRPVAKSRSPLTTEDLALAARMIEDGASGEVVGKVLGVSSIAIYARVRRGNLPPLKTTRFNRRLPPDVYAAIDSALAKGVQPRRIVEEIGVSIATVYRRRQAMKGKAQDA